MNIANKKAKFEYELMGEGLEAGISLMGAEAKSVREGRIDISQSVIRVLSDEVYLINANIPVSGIQKYDSTRPRKLLMHKGEILSLITKMKQKRLQIVPIRVYNKGRLIKLYLELGRGKRKFEKKESIKRHDIERDIEKEFKEKI
jgi:SsrA-binding protein